MVSASALVVGARRPLRPSAPRISWPNGAGSFSACSTIDVDRLVGQLAQPVDLEVLADAVRVAGVEHLLQRRVGHRLDHVDDRVGAPRAAAAAPPRPPRAARRSSRRCPPPACPRSSSGTNVLGRRGDQRQAAAHLVGRLLDEVAVGAQHLARLRRAGTRASRPSRSGRPGAARNSNSVTTPKLPPPPRSPQNRSAFSSALARTTLPSAVTTSAESRLSQVDAVHPLEPAAAAAEREAADAGVGDAAAGDRQPVLLGGRVEVGPRARRPARAPCAPRGRPRRRSSAEGRSRSRRRRCCSRASSGRRRARRQSGRCRGRSRPRRPRPRWSCSGRSAPGGGRSCRSRRGAPPRTSDPPG